MLTSLNGFHNFSFLENCMNVVQQIYVHGFTRYTDMLSLVLQNILQINTLKLKVLLSSLQVCHSHNTLIVLMK